MHIGIQTINVIKRIKNLSIFPHKKGRIPKQYIISGIPRSIDLFFF